MHPESSIGPFSFSLVIPLYRSESSVQSLVRRLEALPCDHPWQAIFVDDGRPGIPDEGVSGFLVARHGQCRWEQRRLHQ
jgi:hypothetical protein